MIIADVKVTLFTRLWDWLFYRPWTPEELHERVARSVANTSYKSWHGRVYGPTPVSHLRHGFTELTAEEIAEQRKERFLKR